jgi:hypothetical protein
MAKKKNCHENSKARNPTKIPCDIHFVQFGVSVLCSKKNIVIKTQNITNLFYSFTASYCFGDLVAKEYSVFTKHG